MTASDHFREGRLGDAIVAVTAKVKANPTDTKSRMFLAELLCFDGEWSRADLQLDAIAQQEPAATVNVAMFRQLIRAEQARQQVFNEGRVPELLDLPDDHIRARLEALVLLR